MKLAAANGSAGIDVSDIAFGADFNATLVHQVVTAYLAGARVGSKAHKSRADVRGGGRKPWRQKGTGRARAGTIRSPLWQGGGKTFAARPRSYAQKVNRKMYRGAMRCILSELVRQDRLTVIEDLGLTERKTSALLSRLDGLKQGRKGLIVVARVGDNLTYSARNVPGLEVSAAVAVNPASLVAANRVFVSKEALQQIERWLG